MQFTLALIKPDAVRVGKAPEIKHIIEQNGFTISAEKRLQLTTERAEQFYAEHKGKEFFPTLIDFMTSGPIEALVLCKEDAIKAWRTLMGPTKVFTARAESPSCIRAQFGTDGTQNATHGSDSPASAEREIDFFFPGLPLEPPTGPGSTVEWTLAMIKPDAVAKGKAQEIKQLIELHGFTIIMQQKVQLTRVRAEEFYAEHFGKPHFNGFIDSMTKGPVWVLVLCRRNAVKAWRDLMGPTSSFSARRTQPRSIRALYGHDGMENAAHGSHTREAAQREIKFFFPNLVLEPLSDADTAKTFITTQLQPALAKALTALARDKPSAEKFEAITFLANYLLANNPNKPRVITPEEWDPSMEEEDDEADFAHAKLKAANFKQGHAYVQEEQYTPAAAPPPREEAEAVPAPAPAAPAPEPEPTAHSRPPSQPAASGSFARPASAAKEPSEAAPTPAAPATGSFRQPEAAPPIAVGSRSNSRGTASLAEAAPAPISAGSRSGSRGASGSAGSTGLGLVPEVPAPPATPPAAAPPVEPEDAPAEPAAPAAPADDLSTMNDAATKVQAAFKGHQARKQVQQMRVQEQMQAAQAAAAEQEQEPVQQEAAEEEPAPAPAPALVPEELQEAQEGAQVEAQRTEEDALEAAQEAAQEAVQEAAQEEAQVEAQEAAQEAAQEEAQEEALVEAQEGAQEGTKEAVQEEAQEGEQEGAQEEAQVGAQEMGQEAAPVEAEAAPAQDVGASAAEVEATADEPADSNEPAEATEAADASEEVPAVAPDAGDAGVDDAGAEEQEPQGGAAPVPEVEATAEGEGVGAGVDEAAPAGEAAPAKEAAAAEEEEATAGAAEAEAEAE